MHEQRSTCYRYDRSLLWTGIVCTVGFVLMGGFSFAVAYWNVDGSFSNPQAAAYWFALFWAGWTALGVWITVFAMRGSLRVGPEGIVQTGCCLTKAVLWRELSQVRWRSFPAGGSVVLRTPRRRVVIEFGVFPRPLRPEIIRCIQIRSSGASQEGWGKFERHFLAAPAGTAKRPPGSRRIACFAFFSLAGLFTLAWAAGLGVQYVALASLNLLAALWILKR